MLKRAYSSIRCLLRPRTKLNDVYAFAKTDIAAGTSIEHGIGGDHFYGMVETTASAVCRDAVMIAALEAEGGAKPRVVRDLKKDQPLVAAEVEIPDSELQRLFAQQVSIMGKDS